MAEPSDVEYRVVVLGSEATGKTCLICQLLYDIFPTDLVSTVEEMYRGVSHRDLALSFYLVVPALVILKLINTKSPV